MKRLLAVTAGLMLSALLATSSEAAEIVDGRLDGSSPQLNDGSYYHYYTLDVEPGRRYTVDLFTMDFRPVLWVQEGEELSMETAAAVDDDGHKPHAQIVFETGRPLTAVIVVNAMEAGEQGEFTVQLTIE